MHGPAARARTVRAGASDFEKSLSDFLKSLLQIDTGASQNEAEESEEAEDETAEERTTRVGRTRGGMNVAARIGEKLRREIGSGRRPRVGDG